MQLGKAIGNSIEERLASLKLELPPAAGAVAAYEPTVLSGNVLYMSGQLPWVAGDLRYKGKIGGELTREQGYAACQLGALNAMAQVRHALGSFDRVRNIIRLEGVLNAAPGFTELPAVLNGASHLVSEVFQDRGRHTRMIYAGSNMPLDCACLITFWTEISG